MSWMIVTEAVVPELELHLRAEYASPDVDSEIAECLTEAVVDRFGDLGFRRPSRSPAQFPSDACYPGRAAARL
jgi:hypothetical protein